MDWFFPNVKNLFISSNFFIRYYIYIFIKENKKYIIWNVLDYWCGESPYKSLFKYKNYVWLDIWESWHDNTKNKDIIFFDWNKIPFDKGYFDSFISTEVFEHVFNLDTVLKEINRVLKLWWYWVITNPFFIQEHEKPYDFWRYTSYGMKFVLEKYGFKIIKLEKSWSYWKVMCQCIRNYLWLLFSSKIRIINMLLKIVLFPLHLIFILCFVITPNLNKDLYFNNLIIVKKVKNL